MKSHNTSNARTIIQGALMAGFSGLAVAALVAAATMVASPRQATATPTYAQQTGQPCTRCHTHANGSGKLKAYGKKFQAKGHQL
jgi:hypothetical protein